MASQAKTLQVQMPDGSWWEVPADIIADNRASYYAFQEEEGHRTAVYEHEFKLTLENDFELEDWAANNMNWSDVVQHAVPLAVKAQVDYQEGWVNGEKRVVREAP